MQQKACHADPPSAQSSRESRWARSCRHLCNRRGRAPLASRLGSARRVFFQRCPGDEVYVELRCRLIALIGKRAAGLHRSILLPQPRFGRKRAQVHTHSATIRHIRLALRSKLGNTGDARRAGRGSIRADRASERPLHGQCRFTPPVGQRYRPQSTSSRPVHRPDGAASQRWRTTVINRIFTN